MAIESYGGGHEITAVEFNPEIAAIYHDFFPNDTVIVADAHQYLIEHYKEFDFIWSSPPCPTHSRMRFFTTKFETGDPRRDRDVKYVDMKLYQEIILLDNYHEGMFIVENVKPYYDPLIPGRSMGRHLVWCNFKVNEYREKSGADIRLATRSELQDAHGFDISGYKIKHRKDTILRNCVDPELGLHILNCAMGVIREENVNQLQLF